MQAVRFGKAYFLEFTPGKPAKANERDGLRLAFEMALIERGIATPKVCEVSPAENDESLERLLTQGEGKQYQKWVTKKLMANTSDGFFHQKMDRLVENHRYFDFDTPILEVKWNQGPNGKFTFPELDRIINQGLKDSHAWYKPLIPLINLLERWNPRQKHVA